MKVVKIMNSPQGRAGRALAGVVLIAAGLVVGGMAARLSRLPAWCRSLPGRRETAWPRRCWESGSAPADRCRP